MVETDELIKKAREYARLAEKATPAPWFVIDDIDSANLGRAVVGDGWRVALCNTREEKQNDADATLIAAAPEMALLLAEMASEIEGWRERALALLRERRRP